MEEGKTFSLFLRNRYVPVAGRPEEVSYLIPQSKDQSAQKVVVLKNHVNIRKTSCKVVKDADDGSFYLEFVFDSNYECEIVCYICA